ncbi:MAG: SDR family oxidoreductase [Labilithrix sp.]|nr:SDR family oxidoreductase [Labilithrix sp.]MCW5809486.1 SDR family oxidoreductase [Labilithrix sp.]
MADNGEKRTALITGASAGLGKEMAALFAADKHDVVLVARSKSKLEELAHELEEAHGITAGVIAADLGEHTAPATIFDVAKKRGLAIDFLVNNAGFGTTGEFLKLDLARELQMIDVNIRALVELTHRFAPAMVERKFGRILNVASTAAFQAGPYMSNYYATKAFVVSFSEGLAYELAGTGVTVTCHCPGATATDFSATAGNDKSKLFKNNSNVADAKSVATHAYRAMHAGDVLAIHGAMNWLMAQMVPLSPRSLIRSITAGLNKPDPS